ncbi:MAG: hypothetical protein AB7F50_10295 [Fimbriimonadaceae bacterium]
MSFIQGVAFSMFWTLALYFQIKVAGLSGAQQVLLGSVGEAAIFLCEIPTGVVADVYSRKLSIVIGYLLLGVAFAVQGFIPIWPVMIIGMVVWGVGETFLSGAKEAWVADEMAHADREDEVPMCFVSGSRIHQLGAIIGAWTGVFIGRVDLRFAPIASGVLFLLLGIALAVLLPEKGFAAASGGRTKGWQGMVGTAGDGLRLVRRSPLLPGILILVFVSGLASEGFDRLWVNHLESKFTIPSLGSLGPLGWFALLASISMVLTWGVLWILEYRFARRGVAYAPAMTVLNAVVGAGVVAFVWVGSFGWAVVLFLVAKSARRAMEPIRTAWVNEQSEPKVRATMLSMSGQAHGLGEIGGGLIAAGLAAATGVRFAITFSGCVAGLVSSLWAARLGRIEARHKGA